MTVTTADNCLFKVTIKTPDEWYSGIFITNFELMKFINLELQLLTSQLFEVCNLLEVFFNVVVIWKFFWKEIVLFI